jgi:hypothetical protein
MLVVLNDDREKVMGMVHRLGQEEGRVKDSKPTFPKTLKALSSMEVTGLVSTASP